MDLTEEFSSLQVALVTESVIYNAKNDDKVNVDVSQKNKIYLTHFNKVYEMTFFGINTTMFKLVFKNKINRVPNNIGLTISETTTLGMPELIFNGHMIDDDKIVWENPFTKKIQQISDMTQIEIDSYTSEHLSQYLIYDIVNRTF